MWASISSATLLAMHMPPHLWGKLPYSPRGFFLLPTPVILSPQALHALANPGRSSHMSALIRGSSSASGPTPSDCDLSSGSNKDRGRVNIHFRIPYYTRWGQSLVLTGAGGLGGADSQPESRSCAKV